MFCKNFKLVLEKFESFSDNFKFEVERPEKIELNSETFNFIPFCDFSINWNESTAFTRVYRKKTSSKIVLPYDDFSPENWKTGTLIGFIRRALTHTSLTHMKYVTDELDFITKQFSACGYPRWLISDKINKTMTKVLYPETIEKQEEKEPDKPIKWIPLQMKWGGKNANRFMNKISKTIPQDFGKVSISYSTTKLRSLLPKFTATPKPFLPKPKEHKCEKHLLRSDLVYIYECDCGAVYIGQTLRRLDVRIKEHQTKKTSAIYQHSLTCPHSLFSYVDRDKFKIVAGNLKHYNARLRYETIYIRYYNTNARSAMNECIASKEMAIF